MILLKTFLSLARSLTRSHSHFSYGRFVQCVLSLLLSSIDRGRLLSFDQSYLRQWRKSNFTILSMTRFIIRKCFEFCLYIAFGFELMLVQCPMYICTHDNRMTHPHTTLWLFSVFLSLFPRSFTYAGTKIRSNLKFLLLISITAINMFILYHPKKCASIEIILFMTSDNSTPN